MDRSFLILSINIGSTSSKIALYRDEQCLLKENITYSADVVAQFPDSMSQLDMRISDIEKKLGEAEVDLHNLSIVVGRGGALPPHQTGAYEISDQMLQFLTAAGSVHASSTSAFIARHIAEKAGCPAIIYDGPFSTCEIPAYARITGLVNEYRRPGLHVLNGRACCIRYAKEQKKRFEDLNLVVAHLGGGISVTAYEKGRLVDGVTDTEGSLTPERAGGLSTDVLVNYSAKTGLNGKALLKVLRGRSGMVSLLGTSDMIEVENRIAAGDKKAALAHRAMCYQTGKCIGSMAAVLNFDVDAILLTGGIAHSKLVVSLLTDQVGKLAPVAVYPGEFEMEAMSFGGLRVLRGEEIVHPFNEDSMKKREYLEEAEK